jgi:hypothetical protein
MLEYQLEQLRNELKQHADILEHLRSVPEYEALATIRRLKSTRNASSVLSSIQGSAHTAARPSEMRMTRATLPPTRSGIEFELNIRHRSVYPVLEPLDIASFDLTALFPDSRRKSRFPSLPESGTETHHPHGEPSITSLTTIPSPSLHGINLREASPNTGHSNRLYCDSRLNRLNIGYWTKIPISNELAARVISNYFETDHLIFACIDADLFVADLVDLKPDYCTPLLLSSLMALACVSNLSL